MEEINGDLFVSKKKTWLRDRFNIQIDLRMMKQGEVWDTCNDMVIAWILYNVSPTIKKSILYVDYAKSICSQLERRFNLTNGSRKYKLSNDLYELKQNGDDINTYFTALSVLWEELDNMSNLPVVNNPTDDVTKLLEFIEKQKEETRLFQFLNGLDEDFGPQRSQLLMLSPLPTVDVASSVLQQEESQRDVLNISKRDNDIFTMYSRNQTDKTLVCLVCGLKGHSGDRCWHIVRFPKRHPKYKKLFQTNQKPPQTGSSSSSNYKYPTIKFHKNTPQGNLVQTNPSHVSLTNEQLEQLLKLIPSSAMTVTKGPDTDDE